MVLAVGTLGLDSASLDTAANLGTAKASGAKYWLRYSAGAGNGQPGTAFKLTGTGEIANLTRNGVDFIANSEWYEARCEEGYNAGHADGVADLGFWKGRGLARGASIYISWDVAPDPTKYGGVAEYYRGYRDGLGSYYLADGGYMGIPALVHFSQIGVIKHGWIPEASSWSVPNEPIPGDYAPPAHTSWDLWQPTHSQMGPAIKYLQGKLAGHKLVSCIWQDRNKWFGTAADENVIVIAGPLGSQMEAAGHVPPPPPPPPPPKPPVKHYGPMHGHAVPPLIARGTGQYFGSIDGPAASHGGFNPGERGYVKLIQQQLIFLGYVPGHSNINDGWADGIYDGGGAVNTGPTSQAVARFQHRHMPGTTFYGQCWYDDWAALAALAKEDA